MHAPLTPQRTPSLQPAVDSTINYASSSSQLDTNALAAPQMITNIRCNTYAGDNSQTRPLLNSEKGGHIPPGWPTSPRCIKSPVYVNILNGIFDVLLLACSITFLIFALVVSFHDQAPTVQYPRLTQTLLNATKYGPTVFPILFASVVGRAAHAILLWRLAKGERIGILDTLASSTSLTNTVASQIQLRTLSFLGFVLVVAWSLSPIGGQATVRLITIGNKDITIPSSFTYMVNSGMFGSFQAVSEAREGQQRASNLFVAALAAPVTVKTSFLDLWGNVKIPRIETYEKNDTMDDEGWYNTRSGDFDAYSSLIGIPISDIDGSKYREYTTQIQTPYLSTSCKLSPMNPFIRWTEKAMPQPSSNCTGSGSTIYWNELEQSKRHFILPTKAQPLKIKYVPTYLSRITFECNITSTYVETKIVCPTSTICMATRVRRSRLAHFPPAWTQLDLSWRSLNLVLGGICMDHGSIQVPQLLDRYIVDPRNVYATDLSVELPKTSQENYEVRFGQIISSYFSIMNGANAITAGINNDTAYFWDNHQTFAPKDPDGGWSGQFYNTARQFGKTKTWASEGTKVERTEVMYAHPGWVIALCIASSVLIASSLIHPLVHYFFSTGVDVAMNISSLATRNNPYIPLPSTGTYLEASDRARLLGNIKVRFGDADNSGEFGSLAIGAFNTSESTGIAQVRKGRVYE